MEVLMIRFIKSMLLTGLFVSLGLANAGCGGDTGTPSQTKKDAAPPGMKQNADMMKEMTEKHGKGAGAGGGEADKDKDKDKAEDKKEDKKAEDKGKGDPGKKDK